MREVVAIFLPNICSCHPLPEPQVGQEHGWQEYEFNIHNGRPGVRELFLDLPFAWPSLLPFPLPSVGNVGPTHLIDSLRASLFGIFPS